MWKRKSCPLSSFLSPSRPALDGEPPRRSDYWVDKNMEVLSSFSDPALENWLLLVPLELQLPEKKSDDASLERGQDHQAKEGEPCASLKHTETSRQSCSSIASQSMVKRESLVFFPQFLSWQRRPRATLHESVTRAAPTPSSCWCGQFAARPASPSQASHLVHLQ